MGVMVPVRLVLEHQSQKFMPSCVHSFISLLIHSLTTYSIPRGWLSWEPVLLKRFHQAQHSRGQTQVLPLWNKDIQRGNPASVRCSGRPGQSACAQQRPKTLGKVLTTWDFLLTLIFSSWNSTWILYFVPMKCVLSVQFKNHISTHPKIPSKI